MRLFLSGPAAGVIGGLEVGRAAGIEDLITVDIGGTSCDIALISRGQPLIRAEGEISGYSVRVPMVDVNAIGAGGGSIAWIDGAGSLRVGPHSAGSEPGPACYGRGGEQATVTDASIILGYINPDYFAAGSLKLSPDLARQTIETTIARPLGLSLEHAALGIHRVLNAQMAEAIRLVSIGRGIDPAGLHAPAAGRRRPAPCDRAGARTGHPTDRRAAASRRAVGDRPALCSRSNMRVPRPFRGCSQASSGRRSNGPSPTATRPAPG